MSVDVVKRRAKEKTAKMSMQLMTVDEVAAWLGLHKQSVWAKARAGEIPKPIRIGKATIRWESSVIEKYLKERREEADS